MVHDDLSNEELMHLEQEQAAGQEVGGKAPPSLHQPTTELSAAFSDFEAGLQVLTSNSSNDK